MADLNKPSIHPTHLNPLPSPSTNDHPVAPRDARAAAASQPKPKPTHPTDGSREIIETIVFVVVLVLLLKSFVAEAFVIPTGSMATTLLGYQKDVVCPKCLFEFPVNCSAEIEERPPRATLGAVCPNCRYHIDFQREHMNPSCNSGDRVLVAKGFYDTGLMPPKRLDVVVFKYPQEPQKEYVPLNYIKRLIGLPGETIGTYYGKLYVLPPDQGPQYPEDETANPLDRWHHDGHDGHHDFMHQGAADSLLLKENSPFQIVRKPPDQILAVRRIVYDNDHPAKDLDVPRWRGEAGSSWSAEEDHGFHHAAGDGNRIDWLRYHNILRGWDKPELITDLLGYNSKAMFPDLQNDLRYPPQGGNWVGDLTLECAVTVDKSEGDLILELSKGVDRFRATWELSSGKCTLTRLHDGREEVLKSQDTKLTKPGTYKVRFANVDERLVVWVDGRLPFGDGVPYSTPPERAPTANDLEPASVGTRGGSVHVHKLTLWRDTYYTYQTGGNNPAWADSPEVQQYQNDAKGLHKFLSDPSRFKEAFNNLPGTTYYVQPGHYLCLGDNSPESSDSRTWGLVPQRLLLGRALFVYYPFWPFGMNRVGPIK
jgi:signal peptidase I